MGIGGAGAGMVEYGSVGSGGNTLFPRAVDTLEGKPAQGDSSQAASCLIVVGVAGDAIVRLGRVEFGEEETVVSTAAEEGAGNQEFKLSESAAIADSSLVGVE